MNDFTKEGLEIFNRLKNPVVNFSLIKDKLNQEAKKIHYKSHDDFLKSSGWKDRFAIQMQSELIDLEALIFNSNERDAKNEI